VPLRLLDGAGGGSFCGGKDHHLAWNMSAKVII
jgi:hypothetical protein